MGATGAEELKILGNRMKRTKRTKAQRKWIRKGYTREMIPLRPQHSGQPRYTFLMRASENWRESRDIAGIMGMPIKPVAQQLIHNGRKP